MYQANGKLQNKEQYVVQYAPLVRRIAHHLAAKLPASVEVDDLIQAGLIGLLDAVGHYDQSQGAQFETYASQRIRGAMLDELREADWAPRSARKCMRTIEAAINRLEQKLGRQPGEQELASELKVPLAEFQQMLQDARGHQLVYYEDYQADGDDDFFERHSADQRPGPLGQIENEDFRAALVEAISVLPEREQMVMSLYYEEELNLKEIGAVLGVTESRVSQLHSQAVARLRSRLKDWLGD
ncbi:RNA polymerase sigma factor FliA [Sulfurimicrobium lacus]|uniref:RNA polymerase sigma factor FliA n=1 Tax=Sulfurimicrobium lacus TaxID=2715678 RepID=A0A6F8VCL5_9PROT|nr:RNA polymerase sigma factor FliA [Sulfurimicrobium lacus]BCB26702.1 RNA polymerase sigma factor FliA [Sulfurimicrobium lacus]